MDKTISFRADPKKVEALDALASMQDRDRSYLLNEAVDHYLDLHRYHVKLIEEGIIQADAGEVFSQREVEKMLKKLPRRK